MLYLDFLEQTPHFLEGAMSKKHDELEFASEWQQLIDILNTVPGAPTLTKTVWQHRLQEWRYTLNGKHRKLVIEANATGGGSSTVRPLKDYEKRALQIFGETVNTGDPDLLVEAGIARAFHIPVEIEEVIIDPPNPTDEDLTNNDTAHVNLHASASFGGRPMKRPASVKRFRSLNTPARQSKRFRVEQPDRDDRLLLVLSKIEEIEAKKAEERAQMNTAMIQSFNAMAAAMNNMATAVSRMYQSLDE